MDAIDAIVAGTHDTEDNNTDWEIDSFGGEAAFARAGPQTIIVRAPRNEDKAWVAVTHVHGVDPDMSGQMAHEWAETLEEAVAAVREYAENRYQYWPDAV